MLNFEGFKINSLDYIFIVDKEFNIVYNSRYDKKMHVNDVRLGGSYSINRNLFEVYPTIKNDINRSSIVRCLTTGEVVIKKAQRFKDLNGYSYCTNNITIPMIRNGKIIGAVELVKDINTIENLTDKGEEVPYDKNEEDTLDSVLNNTSKFTFDSIVTNNPRMLKSIDQAKKISESGSPTLIYGETGTGKEVFVQAMINYSGIPRKKVVIQNCAAMPENLVESILFGTCKGAYTGAENRSGLFDEADGGLLFLDELNSVPYDVQGKLLRVLQDGSFRPVGGNTQKKVNVKVIAAMNEEPLKAIENQHLRKDLFYRLSGGMIFLPPLRERKEDILLFVKHYINEYNLIYGQVVQGITVELEQFFLNYEWAGNVRELKHILESMVSLSEEETLAIQHLPAYMYDQIYHVNIADKESGGKVQEVCLNKEDFNLQKKLEERERELITEALKIAKGNKTKAGELLGIPRQTLKYKIDKLSID